MFIIRYSAWRHVSDLHCLNLLLLSDYFSLKPKYFLVLGILSKRSHFENRNIIRNSWLNDISSLDERVHFKFVVGEHGCKIPPPYRYDYFSCIDEGEWKLPLEFDNKKEFEKIYSQKFCKSTFYNHGNADVAIDFRLIHPVIIEALAIPGEYCRRIFSKPLVVELRDLENDFRLIISTTFTSTLCHSPTVNGCFIRKNISQFFLPANFQGTLIVRCSDEQVGYCVGEKGVDRFLKKPSQIEYIPMLRYIFAEDVLPITQPTTLDKMLFPALLIFRTFDPKTFQEHIENRHQSFRLWEQHETEIDQRLAEESLLHKDLLFINDAVFPNFIDTYRNLPKKLLAFYSHMYQHFDYNFIGKIDDDTYVNLSNIITELKRHDAKSGKYWFGNFRHAVPVERSGKWKESIYSSITYPAFACGSGNIITRSVSAWLHQNLDDLCIYQGEDVAIGIWLSAINVIRIQDERWICDDECRSDMFVSSQHNGSSLSRMWKSSRTFQNPCRSKIK